MGSGAKPQSNAALSAWPSRAPSGDPPKASRPPPPPSSWAKPDWMGSTPCSTSRLVFHLTPLGRVDARHLLSQRTPLLSPPEARLGTHNPRQPCYLWPCPACPHPPSSQRCPLNHRY